MIFLFLYICVRLLIYLSASAYLFACQSVRLLVSVYLCLAGFFTLSICHSLFSQSLLASLFISVSLCLYFFLQFISTCFSLFLCQFSSVNICLSVYQPHILFTCHQRIFPIRNTFIHKITTVIKINNMTTLHPNEQGELAYVHLSDKIITFKETSIMKELQHFDYCLIIIKFSANKSSTKNMRTFFSFPYFSYFPYIKKNVYKYQKRTVENQNPNSGRQRKICWVRSLMKRKTTGLYAENIGFGVFNSCVCRHVLYFTRSSSV